MHINVLSSSKELPFTSDDSLFLEGTLHLASKALFMQSKLKGFHQKIFFNLRDYFVQHRSALALCIAHDCDKDLSLAKAEVDLCIAIINDFCLHAGKEENQNNPARIDKQGKPKIVVAMHYKNFILLQIIKSMVQEIPFGNTLVVKPSKRAVLISQKIKKALSLCGFPKGVVNLVVCNKVQFKELLGDPRVGKVDFLGTKKSADLLPKQFHEGLKQSCIKTIPKIPVLILRDAKIEQVTKQIVMQRLQDAHHLEVIAHPIIVDQSHEKELIQGLIDQLSQMHFLGLKGQKQI